MSCNLLLKLQSVLESMLFDLDAEPFARRFFDGHASIPEYRSVMRALYQTTRHNAAFLRTAGERLAETGRYPALARLFVQKSEEEAGHEELIIHDLVELGDDADGIRDAQVSRAADAYRAMCAFVIESGRPVAFFGPSFLLEALVVSRAETVRRIREHGIVPARALSFFKVHAAADVDHVADLQVALSEITEPADVEAAVLLAKVTAAVYCEILSGRVALRV